MSNPDVVIVGGGLAGLCCARKLGLEGVSWRLFEASDAPGGRIRTDRLDGFLLDRGFQVFLTAYPEALSVLDYSQLDLKPFSPGALLRHEGRFYRLSDPWRDPGSLLSALFSPIGGFGDKYRIWQLRKEVLRRDLEDLFDQEETSTMHALRQRRFSRPFIDSFLKPLFGGVLLDSKLTASNRMFEFVFRMFAEGDVALPAQGMQAIPDQIAAALTGGEITLGSRVHSISDREVKLVTGEVVRAGSAVVVAVEGPEASRLLDFERTVPSRSVCCLYFAAKEPPTDEPMLVLSGSSRGPINNLAVLNLVAPGYAPPGEFLIAATVLGWPTKDDKSLANMVRHQLRRWYGLVSEDWKLLRIYRIEHGQPVIYPMPRFQEPRLAPGLYVCGDHRSTPSIQGAMESGRLTAESLLRELRGEPEPDRRTRRAVKTDRRLREARGDDDDDE